MLLSLWRLLNGQLARDLVIGTIEAALHVKERRSHTLKYNSASSGVQNMNIAKTTLRELVQLGHG